MLKKSHKGQIIGAVAAGLFSVSILVGAGWLFANRQYVADQVTVWSYSPPAEIRAIESKLSFTDKGEFYFRVTQPDLQTAEEFNQDCPRQEPGSPILGCYAAGRMYIYDIQNERLNGIEEVTAAHEMLHAVWERMSPAEKDRIGTILKTEFEQKADEALVERMAYYERNEPTEIINELHSIIPTEVAEISQELETYYQQYFDDRRAVVALHDQYSSVFDGLVERADGLYTELAALGLSIQEDRNSYNRSVEDLSRDIASFNFRANNGDFASISAFNAERTNLVARSNALDALRNEISADIDRYNAAYEEYLRIAGELEALNESIDSIVGELEEIPTFE